MCSNCHKRVAVVFLNKIEKGERTSQGLCIKCAKDMGIPIDNMMGDIYQKMGITPEQMENMEDELAERFPSGEDGEDGGAPAIDLPKLFKDSGIADALKAAAENMPSPKSDEGGNVVPVNPKASKKEQSAGGKQQPKQYKFLTSYCKNLTQSAREGKLDRIVGREPETNRVIQTLCRRQKNNP